MALGADWIEIDVYAVENELVVIHDDRLERTTNGRGYVMAQSLSYLRTLDAGKGEKIPFLREVFDLVDRRVGVNVELKGPGTAAPVAALIDHYVQQRGWEYDQILVSSFDHLELQKIQFIQPRIRRGILLYGVPLHFLQSVENLAPFSVHPAIDFLDPELIQNAKQAGLQVYTYTVNDLEALNKARQSGVDGVFTDYPDRIVQDQS